MFCNSFWHRDPFSHGIFHVPDIGFRDAPPRSHLRRQHHQHQHRQLHHESSYALDAAAEDSEFSSEADFIDRYYLDDEGTYDDHFYRAFRGTSELRPVLKPAMRSFKVKVPDRAVDVLGLREDDVLILPAGLVRMKMQIRCGASKELVQASVTGDMCLRDVLKQLLSEKHGSDAQAWFKLRGEWQTLDDGVKVSHLSDINRRAVDEKPEIEVRIEFAGSSGYGVGGMKNLRGYERERIWGMRR